MKLTVIKMKDKREELLKAMEEEKKDLELPTTIYLLSTSISDLSSIGDTAINDEDPNSIGIVLRGAPGDKQTEAGIRLALASMMEYLLENKKFRSSFIVSRNSFISDREFDVFIFSFKEMLLTSYRVFDHNVSLIVSDYKED